MLTIVADGRPFKWVEFDKPQKAHLHPMMDVCVHDPINPSMGFRDLLRKLIFGQMDGRINGLSRT